MTTPRPHVWRKLRPVAVLLAAAWLGYAGALCVLTTVPRLVGGEARTVVSGSMAPGVPTGSVVLASPVEEPGTDLAVGTIAVVRDPDVPSGVYVHRIVGRDDDGLLVTRGDANLAPDPVHVPAHQVLGRVRAVVPAVGCRSCGGTRGTSSNCSASSPRAGSAASP